MTSALRIHDLIRAERAGRQIGQAYGRLQRATDSYAEVQKMSGQRSGWRNRALEHAASQRRGAQLALDAAIARHAKGPK